MIGSVKISDYHGCKYNGIFHANDFKLPKSITITEIDVTKNLNQHIYLNIVPKDMSQFSKSINSYYTNANGRTQDLVDYLLC